MYTPLVSIIIPVYNGENYLKEAIDSALAQTYTNCEIIVVNDGSTDEGATATIAKSYGNKIRYYEKENGGVASALNVGIGKMQGTYFSWLSHDDWYYPYKVQMQIDTLQGIEDKTTVVHGEYEFYDMGSHTITPTNFQQVYTSEQLTNSVFSVLQVQTHACSALIHKSHFERVGTFDENLLTIQDVELWFKIFRGHTSLFINKPLIRVRVHRESGANYIPCYHEETAKLYVSLINQLTREEVISMFGDERTFLCRMAGFIKSYGRIEYQQIEKMAKGIAAGSHDEKSLQNFAQYMQQLTGKDQAKYIIFGAGQYGIRTQYELRWRGIEVAGFVDNSPSKIGKIIEGIPCYALSDIIEEKEDVLLIIASWTIPPMMEQAISLGFRHIITKQVLDGIMLKYPPVFSLE